MERGCLPRTLWMPVRIRVASVHLIGTGQTIWHPRLLILCVNENVIVVVAQVSRVIGDCILLLPNYIGDEVVSAEHFIAQNLEVMGLIVVNRNPETPPLLIKEPMY